MDFSTAVKTCFSKYAVFDGRARRSEYWFYILFNVLVSIGILIVSLVLGTVFAGVLAGAGAGFLGVGGGFLGGALVVYCLLAVGYCLATLLPTIAVSVRRFHDLNVTGWLYLVFMVLMIVPVLNFIVSIGWMVWFCIQGTVGPNKFGNDPKAIPAK